MSPNSNDTGRQNTNNNLSSFFCAVGSETTSLTDDEMRERIISFLSERGPRDDVLILPPDFTRFHSGAGKLTQMICAHYNFIPAGATDVKADAKSAKSETIKPVSAEDPPESKRQKIDSSSAGDHTDATDGKDRASSDSNDNNDGPPSIQILPALGTHAPMTKTEIRTMFGDDLAEKGDDCFLVHDWRKDVVTIGTAPAEMVKVATGGTVNQPWPAQVNKVIWDKRLSKTNEEGKKKPLVISIGQVVPHEVMGMANYNKNVFIGAGGTDAINLSHFIGAVHGMEKMMGRKDNAVRDILNYCSAKYLEEELDLWYILTVIAQNSKTGELCTRGLFIGNDIACYNAAADLSTKVNLTMVDKQVQRMVAHLPENEFKSTWLGNKAIYRTRMAMADGGQLIILAPGVERFGEDERVDKLIRKYGYVGTEKLMETMKENKDLKDNLSALAHLIHGSTEGRFRVTYCPQHMAPEEIRSVGFQYADYYEMAKKYDTTKLKDGWNNDEDGEFYYISNPALGLWAIPERLEKSSTIGAGKDCDEDDVEMKE